MTTGEAMARVGRLRPDIFGEEIMAGWLSELDGKYRLALTGEAGVPYVWPDDSEKELFVPYPHDVVVYELYLVCMIDWHNREMEAYQNDKAMFDAADAEFRAWWAQTHGSPAAGGGQGGNSGGHYWKVLR